mmetsp:Transcript_15935/g.34499  ORF Transcript_15935/g.34499 Transcript_15935/m.34499 type:complete len:143 (+) Transcript_15935:67-495(+)|eukprot:CAMPEP_0172300252 /NCGR_PEP_ID=MMETSP1058-20130122/2377_1 /TAXON_ID=83371 /ORGANISM="Detonula confervacea, Strain CCMP 353" /LENGTH=142 /DNA_ID=CAMNT_0013009975 /DNA_START=32 /DNA_END=460 /DNA_ORIENTATION=-
MMLQSFANVSFLSLFAMVAMIAASVSAIEQPNSGLRNRNFHGQHQQMVKVSAENNRVCNPTGNGPFETGSCQPNHYCHLENNQCPDPSVDQEGTCMPVTARCNRMMRPVCGCDGKTYSNFSCTYGMNIRGTEACEEEEEEDE